MHTLYSEMRIAKTKSLWRLGKLEYHRTNEGTYLLECGAIQRHSHCFYSYWQTNKLSYCSSTITCSPQRNINGRTLSEIYVHLFRSRWKITAICCFCSANVRMSIDWTNLCFTAKADRFVWATVFFGSSLDELQNEITSNISRKNAMTSA